MRKITEALRLYHECDRKPREIARAIGVSPTTVGQYLRRAKAADIGYPLPEGLCEAALEARLFPPPAAPDVVRREPDWAWAHRELRKKKERHARFIVAGIKGITPGRLSLQLVLRALPAMGGTAVGQHAPNPCARRETVRRLRRSDGAHY